MSITNSPNMNLPVPGVGTETGPDYAFDINTCLTLIDTHDHTPGRGVRITPPAININVDLPFNSNSATSLLNIVFNSQAAATDVLQAMSVAPGSEGPPLQDLWYTDSAGNKVQITSGGQLAAVSTTVQGISYALGTFSFRQTQDSLPTTPANLDAGSVTIRPAIALTPFGVTLAPSLGISSQYTLTQPLPVAATAFLTLDSSGTIAGSIPTSGGIQQANLAANSVGTAQIIDANVTTSKIADGAVTLPKLSAINIVSTQIPNFSIATTAGVWHALSNNSISITAGTWRLTGGIQYSGSNQANIIKTGYFGANGNNTNTTPAVIAGSPTVLTGRTGQIDNCQSTANFPNYMAYSPDTIITVSTTTTIFLDAFSTSTGLAMVLNGFLSAEQLR